MSGPATLNGTTWLIVTAIISFDRPTELSVSVVVSLNFTARLSVSRQEHLTER
ncbi:MAG: hypothetical protein ABIV21_03415 [Pyrinomonadaceae bacterium]